MYPKCKTYNRKKIILIFTCCLLGVCVLTGRLVKLMVFESVLGVIKDRKVHPKEGSYTNYLFDKGIDKILKKLGEEATEIVIASKNPNANEIKYEIADFLYHMMVLMVEKGVTWEEITEELDKR